MEQHFQDFKKEKKSLWLQLKEKTGLRFNQRENSLDAQ